MQITYEHGGASYHINDYFPHLHFQAGAALADQDYDHLIDWSTENIPLQEFDVEAEVIELLSREGASDDTRELNLR